MTPRATRHPQGLADAIVLQLHSWKPFHLDPSSAKRPCRSDRSTAPSADLARLSLGDDAPHTSGGGFRWLGPRKRRRRGSRSVSGRSSDRGSGTHLRVAGGGGTCSDFPMATGGTDSSGDMFANGDVSCASDVSEARLPRHRREAAGSAGAGAGAESGAVLGLAQVSAAMAEALGNESGYGSEPGYRGDAEIEYSDDVDEEDDDGRHLFWGDRIEDLNGIGVGGKDGFAEQKANHRCRRKKQHDWRPLADLR